MAVDQFALPPVIFSFRFMEQSLSIWTHADSISIVLAQALAREEAMVLDAEKRANLEVVFFRTWQRVIEDAKKSSISLGSEYLSSLHDQLAKPVGMSQPGAFYEGTFPQNWSTFVDEMNVTADWTIDGAEAWILAQLYWGKHFQSMCFSLAWLCLGGLRLQEGLYALYPSPEYSNQLDEALRFAGPECWDAEPLRALFGHYKRDQLHNCQQPPD